jgi:hypothetical protein
MKYLKTFESYSLNEEVNWKFTERKVGETFSLTGLSKQLGEVKVGDTIYEEIHGQQVLGGDVEWTTNYTKEKGNENLQNALEVTGIEGDKLTVKVISIGKDAKHNIMEDPDAHLYHRGI